VVDGAGLRHRVRLEQAGEDKAVGTIVATEEDAGEPPYHLTVGLGLLKKRSRFETILEKAVELGVARAAPLRTRYPEKENLRAERGRRILRAALKQSGRCRLPTLAAPASFEETVAQVRQNAFDRVFIAHRRDEGRTERFVEALSGAGASSRLLVLVGPEGGFSEEEVEVAEAAGPRSFRWGRAVCAPRRQRSPPPLPSCSRSTCNANCGR
jgi:16S rRNA (uracil1498-N3)-methyltransferase